MTRPPTRSTPLDSSAASDVYKRQPQKGVVKTPTLITGKDEIKQERLSLSLIHISEPTRLRRRSYAVLCLKKKKEKDLVSEFDVPSSFANRVGGNRVSRD